MNKNDTQYDARWPNYVFEHLYQEQGMKKWQGFYLSDHTARMKAAHSKQIELETRQLKAKMQFAEIGLVINNAIRLNRPVEVQLDEISIDKLGNNVIPEILIGDIYNTNDNQLLINKTKVNLEQIRWIQIK